MAEQFDEDIAEAHQAVDALMEAMRAAPACEAALERLGRALVNLREGPFDPGAVLRPENNSAGGWTLSLLL